MVDVLTKKQRSYNMSSIKCKNTKSTEISLAKLFRLNGIVGWRRNNKNIFGKPDFVFWKNRVAVFVDGCFWHGCPNCYITPKSNRIFWRNKIAGNIKRDKAVVKKLKKNGWNIVRIWEHDIKRNHIKIIKKMIHLLQLNK